MEQPKPTIIAGRIVKYRHPDFCPRTNYWGDGCDGKCTCSWIPYVDSVEITELEKLQMRNRFLEISIKNIRSLLNDKKTDETLEFIDKNFKEI